jgi:hypothetical protein
MSKSAVLAVAAPMLFVSTFLLWRARSNAQSEADRADEAMAQGPMVSHDSPNPFFMTSATLNFCFIL